MRNNGKRIFLCLIFLFVAALSCVMLSACNVDDVKEIAVTPDTVNVRIGEFDYEDYTVTATYASGKTEEFVLKEEMIAPKDRLKFFQEGEYEIKVTYLRATATIKVNVRRNVFAGAEFNDLDVVYNGEFYTVEVKNVPEGTTVTYPTTNRFRTAGEYQATAILRKDAYEMKEMTAKVIIRKAEYDLSEVSFENQSIEYDGTAHILEMTGAMPTGLYVDYTITREGGREEKGNSATNAGNYVVEARFTGDSVNYNEVEPRRAVLSIRQATVDVSGLTFEDKTVVYDRTKQTIEAEGTLPRGVNVTYINNEHVDAGSYEARAVFTVDDTVNFAEIPEKKATLTILKADYDMSAVHFNGTKVTYDGEAKKIEIQGQLPTGITVSYEGNEGTDAGTYEATARFLSNNANYNDPAAMTATLIIDPATAQMDQIVFERRRFIAVVADKEMGYDESDWYDPYIVANEYRPDNVPVGFDMTVEYKKTDDWQADLASEDDNATGYIDSITEDGYYIVKVTFDGGKNYVDEKPTVKTVIRVDTIDNDDISTWEQLVFDDLWVNPETGRTTGVFMNYYTGACTDVEHRKTATIGNVTLEYCDCNVILNYASEGDAALTTDATNDRYIPESKLEDYNAFVESYSEFSGYGTPPANVFRAFLSAAERASNDLEHTDYDEEPTYAFDTDKAAYIGLSVSSTAASGSYIITADEGGNTYRKYNPTDLDPPQNALASLFGFGNSGAFQSALGNLINKYLSDDCRSVAAENPIAFEGTVYATYGNWYLYVLPYVVHISEWQSVDVIFFCGKRSPSNMIHAGVLISDLQLLTDFVNGFDELNGTYMLEGRCLTAEMYKSPDEDPMFRLTEKTVTVNGVEKPVTNGKDLIFVARNSATERLIYGDVEIYRFLTELPGSCAETSDGYNADDYKIATDTTVYNFCDDDVFATIIKADGDASGITARNVRQDHPQMTAEVAGKFDDLSALYQEFISNYSTGGDVINEWKIGASNRNYASYKAFFEYAADMMEKSNRNMGKQSDYVLSKSVIIGLNRAFSVSINVSGFNYTVDEYRLMVAKLFGFTDLETFTAYTDALANVLVANGKFANVDTISARLLYDGAVLTSNGYFVLPYAIKSETSLKTVMAFIFIDRSGAASVWINDAKNAFTAVDFGETVWAEADKYTVTVYGRCLMFEDDGYIMNEDLDKNVVKMIDKLQQYPEYAFTAGGVPENCNATDPDADYYTHLNDLSDRCSERYFGYVFGYDDNGASFWYDECNPFCMIYGSWIFDDVDAVKEHSLFPVPQSVSDAFDSLSEYFAAVTGSVNIPTGNTQKVLTVNGTALDKYVTFFNAAMAIYDESLLSFTKNVGSKYTASAIIGLDHPYVLVFGTETGSLTVDYQAVVANLFGFDDKEEFMNYVEALAALYSDYRNGLVTNKALENGCFFTENGSFVFPIAIKNQLESTVLSYLIIDADGRVAMWINDVDAALSAIIYDEAHCNEYVFSLMNELFCKNMLFAKNVPYEAIFLYCDDDPVLNVQNANGNAGDLTKRADRGDIALMEDEVALKFDALSGLYAELISRYAIQSGKENLWQVAAGGENYAEYRRLFRYARDMFAAANNDLGITDGYLLSGSAIVGVNEEFAVAFAGNDYSMEDYRLMLAKLFGFTDEEVFVKCADALSRALAANEAGASAASIFERLVYDGAVMTANGYFVLPYAIENEKAGKKVLAFVFVDENGRMAVWINNVKDAFALTDFSVVEGDESPDFVYVSGRCVLFETNDYVGWNANGMAKYIAVEKVTAFASEGDFLIYSPFTDEEGFEVYWFSVYGFETEVIYDDSDTAGVGNVHKGFYTMINVAGIDDVHNYNRYVIGEYLAYSY